MSTQPLPRRSVFGAARHAGWRVWLLGAVIGALAQAFWLGGYVTWFLGALCHETGHTVVAIATGSPSFPAIRLDGHAATAHQARVLVLALVMLGGVAWWCWRARGERTLLALRGLVLATLGVAFVSEPVREVLILYAGHGGELAFAGVFLWRAYTGGFTQQAAERPIYAALGWLFVFETVVLSGGLILSPAVRATYMGNGSFGASNDLVRIAQDHWHTDLPTVAVPLLLLALATPLAAWWLGAMTASDRAPSRSAGGESPLRSG